MHTVLLLLPARHFFFFWPFALHLLKGIKLLVYYSLTNKNTIFFQPIHSHLSQMKTGSQEHALLFNSHKSCFCSWVSQTAFFMLNTLILFWEALLFPLSISTLSVSDNSSKASFTTSFGPRKLEKELSWVVIFFAPLAPIISLYSLPWAWEDEKTSKRKISCEPKREIKTKQKSKKH